MPTLRALWITSGDGLDHLVLDSDVGAAAGTSTTLRAVCGRDVLPAALVCASRPMCSDCRRHVEQPTHTVARPRRRSPLRTAMRRIRRR